MNSRRISCSFLCAAFALATLPAAAEKRPLNHHDYDRWHTIQNETLSRDGKFLAYALFPEEGDGEIVVRNLSTGKEVREPAGSLPPAPDTTNFEAPAGDAQTGRGVHLAFTYDGRFLVSTTYPSKADTDQAKKARKRADEMPRGGLIVVDLQGFKVTRVPDVVSFEVPEKGDSFLVYEKGPKPGANPGRGAESNDEADQGRGGRGGQAGGRGRAPKFGSDMVVTDLRVADTKGRTFEDVAEYSLSKDAKYLIYTVASKKDETNGVYSITPGADSTPLTLVSGKGHYTKLTWDREQHEMVFFSDRDDAAGKPAKFKLYGWAAGSAKPMELVSASTPGFHDGFLIYDRGPVSFSRDGERVFLSCAPVSVVAEAEKEPPAAGAAPQAAADTSEKVIADLWRWNDDFIQPMQKVRLAQERARSYRAVYSLADKKFVQLGSPEMATITPSDDGRVALGTDDRPYRKMVDYDGNYSDIYVVDTATGNRKLALKEARGGGGGGRGGEVMSPDAKYFLSFKDKQWWAISTANASAVDLTSRVGHAFFNEENDTPAEPGAYGNGGWTKDGKWVLLYDQYDIWAASPDTQETFRLTNGRPEQIQFRTVRLDREDDGEERGLDPTKPLLLRAENIETRETGFYSVPRIDKGVTPKRLLMGAKNYRALSKAKDADVVLMTATTFHDQPDLYVTDLTFRAMKKVTDANPQQAELLWGTGELIHYRNDDGVPLEAALYKPENFDAKKKYPMIIYIYERLTQNVHNFVRPAPGTNINIAYYVSNGYLVLTPDIVYTVGYPGQSALKCVLPAIQAVVDKGFVDRDHIGIQGHSWGGYQTAYMVTQTHVFRAAEAGAPVVNMIAAYDGIRWGSGLPRQFQYEKTQSRIGGTPWEYPLRYIENSPIFMADRITTPMLIIQNDADDAVPWYQGIEFFLSLRRMGKEAYFFDYNGEPHGLRRRPDQKDYTVRMQQFFDHFLKGAPAPEWMEKGIPYIDREQEKEKFGSAYSETGADRKP